MEFNFFKIKFDDFRFKFLQLLLSLHSGKLSIASLILDRDQLLLETSVFAAERFSLTFDLVYQLVILQL